LRPAGRVVLISMQGEQNVSTHHISQFPQETQPLPTSGEG
jgi:hypothetical protein